MIEQGVWIKDSHTERFPDYPLALSDEWDALWRMIGVQSGPLDSLWIFESEENEAFVERAHASKLPGGMEYFDSLWRPNVMRTLAPHLVVDEGSYFCGISAPDEESAKRRAFNIGNRFPLGQHPELTQDRADIVIFDVDDGLLFVWSAHPMWQEAFTSRSQDWQAIGDWREVRRSMGW